MGPGVVSRGAHPPSCDASARHQACETWRTIDLQPIAKYCTGLPCGTALTLRGRRVAADKIINTISPRWPIGATTSDVLGYSLKRGCSWILGAGHRCWRVEADSAMLRE